MIGFGTKPDTPKHIFEKALDIGYTLIDTKDTNDSIAHFKTMKKSRDKLFICSKLVGESDPENHRPRNIRRICNNALKQAGLTYWDLYYIHTTHAFNNIPIIHTYNEIHALKKDGLIRNVGLSNVTYEQLETLILNCEKPDYIQIEIHPYLVEERLVNLCAYNQIKVVAHSPLGSTLRTKISKEPLLHELSQKYNVPLSQLILSWHVSRGIIPIPSSNNRLHLEANYNAANSPHVKLQISDVKLINALNRNQRVFIKPNHYESGGISHNPLPKRIIYVNDLLPLTDANAVILNDVTLKGFHVTTTAVDNDLHKACCSNPVDLAHVKTSNFLTALAKRYLPKISNVVCEKRITTPNANLQPVTTSLFHRDVQRQKCLKIIIYLCDVDKTTGPFKVIFPEEEVAALTWYKDARNSRLSPEEVHQKFPKDNILSIEGPRHTMIIFEGATLHCGGFVQKNAREVVYLEFIQ